MNHWDSHNCRGFLFLPVLDHPTSLDIRLMALDFRGYYIARIAQIHGALENRLLFQKGGSHRQWLQPEIGKPVE